MKIFLCLIVINVALSCVSGEFHAYIPTRGNLCFAHDTATHGNMHAEFEISNQIEGDLVATATFLDSNQPIHKETLTKHSGTISFGVPKAGRYTLCFEYNGPSSLRLGLHIGDDARPKSSEGSNGESTVSIVDLKSELDPSKYNPLIRSLGGMIDLVKYEVDHLTDKQEEFDLTVSTAYWRVILFVAANFFVMTVAGAWQVFHLRGFFREKKIV